MISGWIGRGGLAWAVGWLLVVGIHAADGPVAGLREYDVLRSFPPGRLAVLTGNDLPDAQGLTGGNRSVGKWIEAGAQRGSCRAVIAAVVAGDLERADQAWRGIETAFAHQREDGGFEAAVRPTGSSAAEGGAAVETAYFFLQEYGRAVLLIRQSPHEAHFRERIAALEPKLRRACAFIAAGESTILPKSRKAVNRVFIAAKAFGTCGKVLGDESLVETSRRLVKEALLQRDADGVFLEHGGRDSSYNAVSILFGEVLGLHVPMPELDAAFPAAARWQASRVLVSGEVDNRGNTRTGVGKEPGYDGRPKSINHGEVTMALTLHGIIHRDPMVMAASDRAFAWMQRESNRTAWVDGTNDVVLDGRNRRVVIDLPPDRKPRAPLLFVFHGFTDSAAGIRATTEFTSVARQRGWVVAYPEGSRDAKGRTFFQVGYDFHRDETVNDVRALGELAGRLTRDLDLDARAIFATGFSNGGDLCYYLAAQPDPFVVAVAPVAGTMMSTWGSGLRPAARIPILAVNMVDDKTTLWLGDPLNRDGWGAYLSVPDVRRAWVEGLGLERNDVKELPGGLRRHRAGTAKDACEVRLYEVPVGGHRWPANLGDPGKSTTTEIVEFFEGKR
ncbi:MAG: prolyl oligopeptidase family serine peptidase [Verrucomicrobia bacterium]|nr:prolyl oligopeptidase family serine peptidase [Verrucomicrobiota bacterium]